MLRERLERLPNFIKRFGVASGLRLGLGLPDSDWDVTAPARAVSVPGMDRPLWLRPTRSDYSIFWQSLVKRQYEMGSFPQTAELIRRAEQYLVEGKVPVIVDGGGNIGLSLRTFAADFPFAHIVSVEPDEENLRVLKANAGELATPHNVVQAGLAAHGGHCRVVARERGSAGLQTEYCATDHPEAIRTVTVPECIAMVPGGAAWIVKLDIEGAQSELFSGNLDWVGEVDCIILELDDWAFPWGGTSVNFFRALAAHRFDYLMAEELILAFRHRA
jgi:FkbM family methyltransferase